MITPRFVDSPERTVVGIGAPFISILSPDRNNMVVIPRLWQEYLHRRKEISNRTGHADLGLCTSLPDESKRTHRHECYYLAGVEVSSLEDVPAGMTSLNIPAGRYAVFTHVGKLDTLGQTMHHIYRTWLPASGLKRREAPDIEIYDQRFNPQSDESEIEIWIPVE